MYGAENYSSSSGASRDRVPMRLVRDIVTKLSVGSFLILLDRPTNAPDWVCVYFDEAQYVAEECVHVPRIRWLIGFRDDRPIGCWLDVQEWVPRRDIRDRGVHCWSHETTHFGRRRQPPAFLTASRSGHACGTSFVPCHGRWCWGELPDKVCILIESSIVVEVRQNHEPLSRMCLLPILDDGGDQLFSSLCLRLHLHVCQQGKRTYCDYRDDDCSRACPSRSHAASDEIEHPTL